MTCKSQDKLYSFLGDRVGCVCVWGDGYVCVCVCAGGGGGGGGERAVDFNFNKQFLTRQVKRTIPLPLKILKKSANGLSKKVVFDQYIFSKAFNHV